MNEKLATQVKLDPKGFRQYARAVSGLFLATRDELLTEMDIRLLWYIKLLLKTYKKKYLDQRIRAEIAYRLELKPQTLYNRISDLKKKGALRADGRKITLSPLFNDLVSVTISYNYAKDGKLKGIASGAVPTSID